MNTHNGNGGTTGSFLAKGWTCRLVTFILCAITGCAMGPEPDPLDDLDEEVGEDTDARIATSTACAVTYTRSEYLGYLTALEKNVPYSVPISRNLPIGSFVVQPGCELTITRDVHLYKFTSSSSSFATTLRWTNRDSMSCSCTGASKAPIAYFYVGRWWWKNEVPLWEDAATPVTNQVYRVKPRFDDTVTFLDGDDENGVVGVYQGKANRVISVSGKAGVIYAKRTSTAGACK